MNAPVPQLLERLRDGDQSVLNQLTTALYSELRRIAARHLRRERPEHTLQTTALVHEAYFIPGIRSLLAAPQIDGLDLVPGVADLKYLTGKNVSLPLARVSLPKIGASAPVGVAVIHLARIGDRH